MGILRTDRVSGLGGANAIKGSVFFDGASTLTVEDSDDFHYDTGDFTIEGWIFATGRDSQMMLLGQWDGAGSVAGSLAWAVQLSNDSSGTLRFLTSSTGTNVVLNQTGSSGTVFDNKWHHFAVTRNGNDYKLFTDGVVVASTTDSNAITNSPFPLTIGGSNRRYVSNTDSSQTFTGFLSNIRIIKGEALYTAAFTPPTSELTVTSNTVFLGCQSSNILREEKGKILTIDNSSTNSGSPTGSGPIPSRFTPNSPVGFSTTTDVGTQFGSTFDGVTTFDSQAYFVPPGGNTRERNRGRGLITGGATGSPSTNVTLIKYFDIASGGITDDFGNLTAARRGIGSVASSTRACAGGGFVAPTSPAHTVLNTIDFVTIANTANASDFGDMQQTAYAYATSSNQTRGLFAGGYRPNNSAVVNTIDLITIATTGNASNFGDLTRQARSFGGAASTTRGVFFGGTYPAIQDVIDFVTIATTGDATDFGNLTDARDIISGSSSNTRAVMGGGRDPSNTNIIDFITIASEGNATDFGDLTAANYFYGASSNNTRAVWASDASTNIMEFVTIATTGNSSDFGDQNGTPQHLAGVTSDSHGGLE